MGSLRAPVFSLVLTAGLCAFMPQSPEWPAFHGLTGHQLLQRGDGNAASVSLHGTAPAGWDGAVTVTALPALDRRICGRAGGGAWQCSFRLPTGGPYDVILKVQNAAGVEIARRHIDDILVGDIWLLAGQSNMQGRGDLIELESPSPMVRSFDLAEHWVTAAEPLHRFWEARDPIYHRETPGFAPPVAGVEGATGAGLGLTFAKTIAAAEHTPVALIPCALGGSSITQWDKARRQDSLYEAMLRRLRLAGGKARGILWYQGEADARDPRIAPLYGSKLHDLIAAVRTDSGIPDLRFYVVQIGRMLDWPYYGVAGRTPPTTLDRQFAEVREAQRRTGLEMDHVATAASIDLNLRDGIHLSTPDLKRLGRRLAKLPGGPSLQRITHDRRAQRIYVSFSGVTGGFAVSGRIAGFSLRTAAGAEIAAIYSAAKDPHNAGTIVLSYQGELPGDARLTYGWGANPYCNLVDGADMAAPCFGPVPLGYASE